MCFSCFSVVAFQTPEFLQYCLCDYSTYKWLTASCATNCTNRTKCRLTFISLQKTSYFCPVTAITNTAACSGFPLFSFSKFPPPPLPHLHHFLHRYSLNMGFIISCFSRTGITGNWLLNSHTLAQIWRDGREGGWYTCCWTGHWSPSCHLIWLSTAQHLPQAGFHLPRLELLHKPQLVNNGAASEQEF